MTDDRFVSHSQRPDPSLPCRCWWCQWRKASHEPPRRHGIIRNRSVSIVTTDAFPHGVRCADCNRPLEPGAPYAEQPDAPVGEDACALVVCVPCSRDRPDPLSVLDEIEREREMEPRQLARLLSAGVFVPRRRWWRWWGR
jgi:hypothetical protein